MSKGAHYVVVCYLGPRRAEYLPQVADRLLFLRAHLQQLAEVPHTLEKITVVLQEDSATAAANQAAAEWIAASFRSIGTTASFSSIGTTPVLVVRRDNDNSLSYGALADVADPAFAYTIFNEDDYLFCRPHFDEWLVEQIARRPDVALLCGAAYPYVDGKVHAGVSTGIVRTAALRATDAVALAMPGAQPQVLWSRQLATCGLLVDWLNTYATVYRMDDNGARWMERPYNPSVLGGPEDPHPFLQEPSFRLPMIIPVQCVDHDVEIRYWSKSLGAFAGAQGRLSRDGSLLWL